MMVYETMWRSPNQRFRRVALVFNQTMIDFKKHAEFYPWQKTDICPSFIARGLGMIAIV